MLFCKSELNAMGGLQAVRDFLCEDFLLGRLYASNRKKVILSRHVVHNVNIRTRLATFADRHSRWLKMRAVIHRPSFIADPLINPTPWALLLPWVSGFSPLASIGAAVILMAKVACDASMVELSRGTPMAWRHRLLGPLKDLVVLSLWPYAAWSRSVNWRGLHLRMTRDTLLYPDVATKPHSRARGRWWPRNTTAMGPAARVLRT